MAQSTVSDRPDRTQDSEALRDAEMRAENAERRVDELEERLEKLESERSRAGSSTNSEPARSVGHERWNADGSEEGEAVASLRTEPMMDHLLNALDAGQDIGHYGRLVFAMVAHHFLTEDAMLEWLGKDPGINEEEAGALLRQVEGRDYNPPRRERILAWQAQQEFPILPNPDDPDCGNVYRNLKFPQSVYDHIEEYQEEKMQARDQAADRADSK